MFRQLWKPDAKTTSRAASAPESSAPVTRVSNGLEQFFSSIAGNENLRILDLAGATQANITFITSMGYMLYSDDILHALDDTFGRDDDSIENQSDPERVERFLSQALDFPPAHFDAVLVWDVLQFLSPTLLQLTIDRLRDTLRSSASLIAYFNAEERAKLITVYSYQIVDTKTLALTPRGQRKPVQFFNNRSLEKLFQGYQSIKFFLTRDNLREVIVRR